MRNGDRRRRYCVDEERQTRPIELRVGHTQGQGGYVRTQTQGSSTIAACLSLSLVSQRGRAESLNDNFARTVGLPESEVSLGDSECHALHPGCEVIRSSAYISATCATAVKRTAWSTDGKNKTKSGWMSSTTFMYLRFCLRACWSQGRGGMALALRKHLFHFMRYAMTPQNDVAPVEHLCRIHQTLLHHSNHRLDARVGVGLAKPWW
jgi:hypothetical protein